MRALLSLLVFSLLIFPSLSLAQNPTPKPTIQPAVLQYARVTPDSPLHLLKSAGEKIRTLLTIRTNSKISLQSALAQNRINEINTLASNQKINQIRKTLESYSKSVEAALQLASKDEKLRSTILVNLSKQMNILEQDYQKLSDANSKQLIAQVIDQNNNKIQVGVTGLSDAQKKIVQPLVIDRQIEASNFMRRVAVEPLLDKTFTSQLQTRFKKTDEVLKQVVTQLIKTKNATSSAGR